MWLSGWVTGGGDMRCMLCGREVDGFVCVCGWRRTSRSLLWWREEETMEGVCCLMERDRGARFAEWVGVPAGSMMVVDDVEVG